MQKRNLEKKNDIAILISFLYFYLKIKIKNKIGYYFLLLFKKKNLKK